MGRARALLQHRRHRPGAGRRQPPGGRGAAPAPHHPGPAHGRRRVGLPGLPARRPQPGGARAWPRCSTASSPRPPTTSGWSPSFLAAPQPGLDGRTDRRPPAGGRRPRRGRSPWPTSAPTLGPGVVALLGGVRPHDVVASPPHRAGTRSDPATVGGVHAPRARRPRQRHDRRRQAPPRHPPDARASGRRPTPRTSPASPCGTCTPAPCCAGSPPSGFGPWWFSSDAARPVRPRAAPGHLLPGRRRGAARCSRCSARSWWSAPAWAARLSMWHLGCPTSAGPPTPPCGPPGASGSPPSWPA